jgi:EmrB/QacA subfamily drug resistance transporter
MAAGETAMTAKQKWVLGLASLGSFMVALDSQVVTTALATIHKDLHASLASLEWTVNAYNLTFAVLLLSGAALGDKFGRQRMFAVGLALFTVASAACALSTSIGPLITARAVQGAGAAIVLPLALTQVSVAFPPQRRGQALGLFSGLTGLAVFSGPFIGGAVAQGLDWHWIFWINIPIGAIAIALVLLKLDESTGPNVRFDFPGVALVTGGTLGVVWALVRGNDVGWGSGEVLGTLIAGLVLGAGFVVWSSRSKTAMLPMRFFKVRTFTTANVSNFSLYASMYGTLFLLTQYLQNALGYGPMGAGLRVMPWTGTLMICGPIAGRLVDKLGERRFMVTGLALNTIGMAWFAIIAAPDLAYATMVPPLIVSGCGLSMAMPAAQKSVIGAVKPQEIGQASGAITMLRILGGVFGIAIITAVFAGHGSFASPKAFTDGFTAAMIAATIISGIGAAVGLGMAGKRPAPVAPPQPATPVSTSS